LCISHTKLMFYRRKTNPSSLSTQKANLKKWNFSWVHACNPSYSGGRDQEDCGLRPAQPNSSWEPILKTPITKKGWRNDSRPWLQTLVCKQTNKQKKWNFSRYE
jgi:hypothetical protein